MCAGRTGRVTDVQTGRPEAARHGMSAARPVTLATGRLYRSWTVRTALWCSEYAAMRTAIQRMRTCSPAEPALPTTDLCVRAIGCNDGLNVRQFEHSLNHGRMSYSLSESNAWQH